MSDTPKTDIMASGNSDPSAEEYDDLLGFARQLERELIAKDSLLFKLSNLNCRDTNVGDVSRMARNILTQYK